jgi:hypothetical protein
LILIKTLIHIGFPRTGTTWFQKNFFPKVENYLQPGRKLTHELLIHPTPLEFNPEDLKSRIPPSGHFIISEEMITSRIRGGEVNHWFFAEYIKRLNLCYPDAHFMLLIRNQQEIIQSLYALYVQKGGTYSLEKFLLSENQLQSDYLFSSKFLNFHINLEYLIKTIGKERLHVFLFEDFRENPEEFIQKLGKKFQLVFNNQSIDYSKVNTGITTKQIFGRKLINRFTRYGIPFKHYYFHVPGFYKATFPSASKMKQNKLKLDLSDSMIDEFQSSNKQLKKQFPELDLEKYGYLL